MTPPCLPFHLFGLFSDSAAAARGCRGGGGSEPVTRGEYNGRWFVGNNWGGPELDPVGVTNLVVDEDEDGAEVDEGVLSEECSRRICSRVRKTS